MQLPQTGGLEAHLDPERLSAYQITIIVVCAAVAMIDGFDTQSIALVAPAIASAWRVAPSVFGPVFGAGLFGGMIGAVLFGVMGDRVGRRPTLLLAIVVFGITVLATAFTRDIAELTVARFLTGIGLGGALPSVIAVTSEISPKRIRSTAVTMMFCGFPLGAAVGGVISARLIPLYGWTSVFYAGGSIPILLLPAFWLAIPESIRFLAMKKDRAGIARILAKMKWSVSPDALMVIPVIKKGMPVAGLFQEGLALGTVLLCAILFCSLLLTYFLINWIPVVTVASGIRIQSAILGVAALNVGAIVGCVVLGRLADRCGNVITIASAFGCGAIATAAIGQAGHSSTMLLIAAFAAGFLTIGAQMCTVALCASFYETAIRATGIGWTMAVGRTGAIVGPVVGGLLIGAGMLMPTLFIIAGIISLCAAIIVLILGRSVLGKPPKFTSTQTRAAPGGIATVAAKSRPT